MIFYHKSIVMSSNISDILDMDVKQFKSKSMELTSSVFLDDPDMYDMKLKYKIKKKPIGKGSFSIVYYATDNDGNEYAIKGINIKDIDSTTVDKFMRELSISEKMKHENVVKCIQTFKTDTHYYIVSEFCNCGTFAELIKKIKDVEPIKKENLCLYYLTQLKDALQYLNINKIVHRDLKPMNILMTKNNSPDGDNKIIVKLADFGFARYFDSMPEKNSGYDDTIASICGTPNYMAPELLINARYNTKADLWSFGVIMYEMLYSTNLYNYPKNFAKLRELIMTKKITFEKTFSNKCLNLLKKLLQTNPSKRIEWDDFFNHTWFNVDDDSDSDSDNSSDDDFDHVSDSDDEYKDATDGIIFDEKKESNTSTLEKKSILMNCVDDYIKPPEINKSTYTYSSSRGGIPIPVPRKDQKKVKTYKETENSSYINIFSTSVNMLANSMSYFYGQAKSY